MKNYKDYSKQFFGKIPGKALSLAFGDGRSLLAFGAPCDASAYIVDDDAEIGSHYELVASGVEWLRIYSASNLIASFTAASIEVYRAGDFGCIIKLSEAAVPAAPAVTARDERIDQATADILTGCFSAPAGDVFIIRQDGECYSIRSDLNAVYAFLAVDDEYNADYSRSIGTAYPLTRRDVAARLGVDVPRYTRSAADAAYLDAVCRFEICRYSGAVDPEIVAEQESARANFGSQKVEQMGRDSSGNITIVKIDGQLWGLDDQGEEEFDAWHCDECGYPIDDEKYAARPVYRYLLDPAAPQCWDDIEDCCEWLYPVAYDIFRY